MIPPMVKHLTIMNIQNKILHIYIYIVYLLGLHNYTATIMKYRRKKKIDEN